MAIFDKFMDLLRDDDDDDDYDPDEYDAYQEQEAKKAEKKRLKEQKAAEAAARKKERAEREADMPRAEKKSGGFLNKIKSIMSDDDDEDDDYGYEEYLNENADEQDNYASSRSSVDSRRSYASNRSVIPTNNYKHASNRSQSYSQQAATGKTANFNVNKEEARPQKSVFSGNRENAFAQRQSSNAKAMAVNIIKPTGFEDCQDICDTLLNGKPIIVNLEGFDLALAQRVMDFVSGCVYSINGKLHQISGYVFIISPDGVDVSGDYLALMKEDGFGVPTFNRY